MSKQIIKQTLMELKGKDIDTSLVLCEKKGITYTDDVNRPKLKVEFLELTSIRRNHHSNNMDMGFNLAGSILPPVYKVEGMPEDAYSYLKDRRSNTRKSWAETDKHLIFAQGMEMWRQTIEPDFRLLTETEISDTAVAEWNGVYTDLVNRMAIDLAKKAMMEGVREFSCETQNKLYDAWERQKKENKRMYALFVEGLKNRFVLDKINTHLPEVIAQVILTEWLGWGSERQYIETKVLNVDGRDERNPITRKFETPKYRTFHSSNPFREAKQNAFTEIALPKYKIKCVMALNKLCKEDLVGWAVRFMEGVYLDPVVVCPEEEEEENDIHISNKKLTKEKILEFIMKKMDENPRSIAKRGYLALKMALPRIKRGKRVFTYNLKGYTEGEAGKENRYRKTEDY